MYPVGPSIPSNPPSILSRHGHTLTELVQGIPAAADLKVSTAGQGVILSHAPRRPSKRHVVHIASQVALTGGSAGTPALPDLKGAHTFKMFSNGDSYMGTTLEGLPNGQGTFTYAVARADGLKKYEGQWSHGKKSGEGIATFENGTYTGHFVEDRMEGQGKWVEKEGMTQEGTFKEGKLQDGVEKTGQIVTPIYQGKPFAPPEDPNCCTIL